MINPEEYTVISFGDSFTYGHGITEVFQDTQQYKDAISRKDKNAVKEMYRKDWKLCSAKTYTKWFSTNAGFKKYINFGIPGGSNQSSLYHMQSYLNENLGEKFFILFNLTSPFRTDIVYKESAMSTQLSNLQSNFNQRDIEGYFYINSEETAILQHIYFMKNLYNTLRAFRHPYIVFDILNDTDIILQKEFIKPEKDLHIYPSTFVTVFGEDIGYNGVIARKYINEVSSKERMLKNYIDTNFYMDYTNHKTPLYRNKKLPENENRLSYNFYGLHRLITLHEMYNGYNRHEDHPEWKGIEHFTEKYIKLYLSEFDKSHWGEKLHREFGDFLYWYLQNRYSEDRFTKGENYD